MSGSPISYQTFIVIVLTVASGAITAMLGNADVLGLKDKLWLTIVVLPAVSSLITLASNQLKSIGSPPPGVPLTPTTIKPPETPQGYTIPPST
jgi:hypothetical protein